MIDDCILPAFQLSCTVTDWTFDVPLLNYANKPFLSCSLVLQIIDADCVSAENMPSIISSLQCVDVYFNKQKSAISLTLTWQRSDAKLDAIDHINIFASVMTGSAEYRQFERKSESEVIFLGRAYCNCFRVVDFPLPFFSKSHDLDRSSVALEFRVQPVTVSRQKLPVNMAHILRIWMLK